MASPTQLKEQTLATLRGIRQDMSTARWLMAIGKQPIEVQREAAFKRLDVEQAILALGNENLSEIGEKLKANEAQLVEGRDALIAARKKLSKVVEVLGTIGKLLDVVKQIVMFPAGL